MDKLTDIDLLEQFLRGELSERVIVKLESRLEKELVLARQLVEIKELQNGIRYARLESQLEEICAWEIIDESFTEVESDFEQDVSDMIRIEKNREFLEEIQGFEEVEPEKEAVIRGIRRYSWGVAASILFILSFLLYFLIPLNKSENERLVDNLFDIYPIINNTRGGASNSYELLGFENYLEGDFKTAEENFLTISSNKDLFINFYLGISQLGGGHSKAAITTLEKLKEQSDLFEIPTYWYLALSYLDLGEIKIAKDYLELVINAKDFKATEAVQLKERLEN